MKKLHYIQPQAEPTAVDMQYQLLANSNQIDETAADVDLNPNTMIGGDGADAAGRSNSIWDEEEENW